METSSVTSFPPNVKPEMLSAAFWMALVPESERVLFSPEAIAAFNAQVPARSGIPAVFDLPETLSAARVRDEIADYSRPTVPRYGVAGELLEDAYFDALQKNATPDLPEQVTVRFGLITRRTEVRAFPTAEPVTREPFAFAFDRIQETTVDIGWPVVVVSTSQDGRWFFALTSGYWGWLRAEDVAFGLRDEIEQFTNAEPFVVTTGSRALVAVAEQGNLTPQMGTRLPLTSEHDQAFEVVVPLRTAIGTLRLVPGWIAKASEDVAVGYLPFSVDTLLTQAFKLLGERYAWGGSRMGIFGRDCSRLVRDTYATTGVMLPRNGDQQEQAGIAQIRFTPEMTASERLGQIVERATPGSVFVLPGHVMLYLGAVDDVPFVIHDTSSSGYDGVIVSDLSLGADGPSGSLLERLTSVVSIG